MMVIQMLSPRSLAAVMDYEQYNEYIKQQQSQIDQQKIDEMLDAMQSIQVTEQEATEN